VQVVTSISEECIASIFSVASEDFSGWLIGKYALRMEGGWNWLRICFVAGFGISGVEPWIYINQS
jgi:hypothetical protein